MEVFIVALDINDLLRITSAATSEGLEAELGVDEVKKLAPLAPFWGSGIFPGSEWRMSGGGRAEVEVIIKRLRLKFNEL